MARPLRIEFAGAVYHVTSRGDGREDIYLSDADRVVWLEALGEVCHRFNWVCHAYCLMTNHYHFLIETPEGNLSKGMRQLNGVYTQRFNRSHGRVGHVFQGRYKAILVEKENYLLELSRYVVLNPVRAGIVRAAKDWAWSSYRATAGFVEVFPWLNTDLILSEFSRKRKIACEKYRQFVSEAKGQPSPWQGLKNRIFIGSDQFVETMQRQIGVEKQLDEIPNIQKRAIPKPLGYYTEAYSNRNESIYQAYHSGGYTMKDIATHFGLHYSSVSKIIKRIGGSKFKT